jgi:hypothetical protein
MAHKKIYYMICVLVVVIIFGTAAICNMCGNGTAATDKIGTDDETAAVTTAKPGSSTTTDKGGKDTSTESTAKASGTESSDSSSESSTASESTADESIAPTIILEVYEGPTYSAGDDICYYRVKATVTGSPAPTVKFSKDDSYGAWGAKKVQVNIHRGQPYTLTATAKNSAGESSATINLAWGCGSENRDPVINDITLSSASIKTGQQYDVTGNSTDPDGDVLAYKWTVSGGAINNDAANPMKWTAPAAAGSYNITLKIADGKGGGAEMTKSVNVESSIVSLSIPKVASEGGYIESGGYMNSGGCLFAGDTGGPSGAILGNRPVRGFISFDIASLAGKSIDTASMTFNLKKSWGVPADFGTMWIGAVAWGSEPLVLADFDLVSSGMQSIGTATGGSFTADSANFKTQLQSAINAGKTRFQVRIHWSFTASDSDNTWDGWEYDQSGINFNITYH